MVRQEIIQIFRQVLFFFWGFLLLWCAVENPSKFWCTTFSSKWCHIVHLLVHKTVKLAIHTGRCTLLSQLSQSCICQLMSNIWQSSLVSLKTWAQLWKVISTNRFECGVMIE
jgi:hypothetical protein